MHVPGASMAHAQQLVLLDMLPVYIASDPERAQSHGLLSAFLARRAEWEALKCIRYPHTLSCAAPSSLPPLLHKHCLPANACLVLRLGSLSWIAGSIERCCVMSCSHCLPVKSAILTWQLAATGVHNTGQHTNVILKWTTRSCWCIDCFNPLPASQCLAAGECYCAVQACLAHIQLGAHSATWSHSSTADPQRLPI